MRNKFTKFLRNECGAVTVDWVVLAAAIVAISVVAITSIQSATNSVGSDLGETITSLSEGGG